MVNEATCLAGPFAPRGDNPVKDQEAHNPSIARDEKNKRWCLFYIGRSPIDGPPVTPAYPSGIADIAVTCAPSQAAYSSSEMAARPAMATLRSRVAAKVAAPMPAPPTSGHCKLHATGPKILISGEKKHA